MSEERPTSDAAQESADGGGPSWASETENARERATDADAWATACAEDLAAEKARRRAQYGRPPGSAAEELRKLVDAVADKLSGLQTPLFGAAASGAAQQMVQQAVQQAKAAVEPVIERHPEVFDHLAAAGSELLAAYRSAVEAQERRWAVRTPHDTAPRGPEGDEGPGERIDLD
ncbi:DUF5304 domain-containing protein [Streptomyces chiangmaiensis]|uniref:DUF5304 domain-containing protein n=1 Tax=Streptomyces chiangmaiensis TaxID=766497 RepID=A0ABU7F999_9ACTN|nr:DUF5304 domain-containing protein [Streptomyces chiangmaiensis]MED7820420.1 DUF5304 domain-containing protein [Streptomyces chiangmaiensis]